MATLLGLIGMLAPGCVTFCPSTTFDSTGTGTRTNPRVMPSLPGVDRLSVDSKLESVTLFGKIHNSKSRDILPNPTTLKKGDAFADWGFNISETFRFIQLRDEFAVFERHLRVDSCMQPSPTHHEIETIAVAPYETPDLKLAEKNQK